MIAIEVKYLSPTNFRGSRYVASTCNGHRLVVSNNDNLTPEFNALAAARALANNAGWYWRLVDGDTKAGWCFTFDTGNKKEKDHV